jgi:hypothetical protein
MKWNECAKHQLIFLKFKVIKPNLIDHVKLEKLEPRLFYRYKLNLVLVLNKYRNGLAKPYQNLV